MFIPPWPMALETCHGAGGDLLPLPLLLFPLLLPKTLGSGPGEVGLNKSGQTFC